MTDNKYNGWTNYETWLFNLHFDNYFEEDARQVKDVYELSKIIESAAAEYVSEELQVQHGFIGDMLNSALRSINYYEIAEHYMEDIEPCK